MSALRTTPSRARTAVRLFAELVGFAALLFVTRYVARGHLVPQMDQECYIGGIAVDVRAHGVRFPLLVYAPNEYDNGSFFSGLLAALSFSLFGRRLLALKLATHVISAAGAVATLWLLRGCLEETRMTRRPARWAATAAVVIGIALAPRVVTVASMQAVGNHAEGSAIDTLLLALFACRLHTRSAWRTAGFWFLVGCALYLNKGTSLVIPVLAVAEVALAWRAPRRLGGALCGFVLGVVPELAVIMQRHGMGWDIMGSKVERNAQAFPYAFLDSILNLAEHRIELLAVWVVAVAAGTALLVRSWRQSLATAPASVSEVASGVQPAQAARPVTLALVVGVTWLHLGALTVMAQGGIGPYAIYGYPTVLVLVALLLAVCCTQAAAHWGNGVATWAAAAAVALTVVLYRPDAVSWGLPKVAALWRNQMGAACFWRFAEGFEREHDYGLAPPGRTREQHAIERCRSLSDQDQVLDCIGGIARELNWRQNRRIDGEPPAGLNGAERRAYAYYYGTHRGGNITPCNDFTDPDLAAVCAAAVRLECLVFGDALTRIATAEPFGRPRCTLSEPPLQGYWAAMRLDFLARPERPKPNFTLVMGNAGQPGCKWVLDGCY